MRPLNKRALSHVLAISLITNPVYAGSIFEAASGAGRWLKTKLGASAPVPTTEVTHAAESATIKLPAHAEWIAHQDGLEEATQGVLKNLAERVDKNLYLQTIGRDKELTNFITAMNNPASIGIALEGSEGVGKTQIAYGYQEAVKNKAVPNRLLNSKVIEVSSESSLVEDANAFGTKLQAMKTHLELEKEPNTVIVLHFSKIEKFLMDNSKAKFDAYVEKAQSVLGRGRVKIVVEGTDMQLNKLAENNAFARQLAREKIAAPNLSEIEKIANAFNKRLDSNMRFSAEAIQKAISYADTFFSNLGQPYATIHLMSETASLKETLRTRPESVIATEIKKKIDALKEEAQKAKEIIQAAKTPVAQAKIRLAAIPQKIKDLELAQAEMLKSYNKFLKMRNVVAEIEKTAKQLKDKSAVVPDNVAKEYVTAKASLNEVQPEDVALVTALRGKAQLDELLTATKPMTQEERLARYESRIFGQPHVINLFATLRKTITNTRRNNDQPVKVMLLLGPPGVGKTSSARAIAEVEFGTADKMIYEEMKKYSSEVASSGVTGGAPNYVGYGDGTDLISRMKAIEDGGVLLLDEAEAAHKDIFNKTFNRAFQDGYMTNTIGKTTKMKNMVVVVTTNAGGHFTSKATREEIIEYFTREGIFPPDFLDRLDDVVVFDAVDTSFWGKIFDQSIASYNQNILAKELNYLRVSEKAREKLLSQVEVGTKGSARDVKRTIKKLENEIDNFFKHGVYENLDGRQIQHDGPLPGPGDLIEIDWDDASGLIFKISEAAR